MTDERKKEIIRSVIYANMNKLSLGEINAFTVGRIFGLMEKDLERELSKEVDNTGDKRCLLS